MLVEATALRKTYKMGWLKKRSIEVIKEARFFVNEGETVGLVGESGSGKTTLGLLLTGLLKPDEGKILFKGKDITELSPPEKRSFRRQVQIIFQHPEVAFNPRWKLIRSLVEPYKLHKIPFTEKTLLEHLKAVGLSSEHLGRYPSQLSGGELQRAAIARAIVLKPKFMVLDEPTSMLDAITQAQIIRLLEAIQRETGVAYLFVSHDLELAQLLCRRIYRLVDGKLQEQPPTARSFSVPGPGCS